MWVDTGVVVLLIVTRDLHSGILTQCPGSCELRHPSTLITPEIFKLLLTHLTRDSPAAVFKCELQTPVWTPLSEDFPELMSENV